MAHGDGSGSEGDEAAWLDLIARYDAPAPTEGDGTPWPEREDLVGPLHVTPADALPDTTTAPDAPQAPDVTVFPPARLAGPGGAARGSAGPGGPVPGSTGPVPDPGTRRSPSSRRMSTTSRRPRRRCPSWSR